MARYKFTQAAFDEICLLLKRRVTESREEQKRTRAAIRKFGFKISDYSTGFSDIDFKNLLTNGEIEITGNPATKENHASEKPALKDRHIKTNNSIQKQALPPIIDHETEYLVLGTMPGEKSLLHQEYYNNPQNQFWRIISVIFNKGNSFSSYRDKVDVLKKHRIGLWDVLGTCERADSLDSNIKNPTINDFHKLFQEFPNIKTVVFNGKESYKQFSSTIKQHPGKVYLQLPSTSSTNTHQTAVEKIRDWKNALTKNHTTL